MKPILVLLAITLASCGGSSKKPNDAPAGKDDAAIDALAIPAPPTLGAQIDRMGRPLINTALNATFQPAGAAKTAQKDAYNHAADPATWLTTPVKTNTSIVQELATNIAILDMLDQGSGIASAGCGNTPLYTAPPSTSSYNNFASLLADDELYVDTSLGNAKYYLSLELEHVTEAQLIHDNSGGRAPSYDVIDFSYSVLAGGTNGLAISGNIYTPKLTDGVAAHGDASDMTFPFLGVPH